MSGGEKYGTSCHPSKFKKGFRTARVLAHIFQFDFAMGISLWQLHQTLHKLEYLSRDFAHSRRRPLVCAVCCSCTLFLGPLLGTCLFYLLCLRCKQTAKTVTESNQNRVKMFLGVTSELHGKPLVPKLRPCWKKNNFLALPCGTLFEIS